MKTKIAFDEHGYKSFINDFTGSKQMLQRLYDSFKALNIGDLTSEDLHILFTDRYEDVIFDKVTEGKELVLNGIKINKQAALSIIEKSAGYDGFVKSLTAIKKDFGHGHAAAHNSHVKSLHNYVIDGGRIELCEAYLTKVKESRFTFYTTNVNQEEYYEALTTFINSLERLLTNGLSFSKGDVFNHIDEFVFYKTHTKKFEIKYRELSGFLTKTFRDK